MMMLMYVCSPHQERHSTPRVTYLSNRRYEKNRVAPAKRMVMMGNRRVNPSRPE